MRITTAIILFCLIFSQSDSVPKAIISDYFKDLKLKNLQLDPKDILNSQSLFQDHLFLSNRQVDSIKLEVKNFIPKPVSKQDTIIMETNKGTLKLVYYPDVAPRHCYNFKKLANSGFYDNTKFHRIIKNFMIQGGDILSRDRDQNNDGLGGPGWQVDQEFNNIKHKRGILSMARGPDPNSAGSQFFICHKDSPWLDGSYTVFGEVVEGIHVLDLIAETPTKYTTAKNNCLEAIPNGDTNEQWIELKDPKTRKLLYAKIPEGESKVKHKESLLSDLRSDVPTAPVIIKSIRVINEN